VSKITVLFCYIILRFERSVLLCRWYLS